MTSAVAGYLLQGAPAPEYDDLFDDFMQDVVIGITGLDPKLVRPRWQLDPPTMPGRAITWVGIGVGDTDSDAFAYQVTNPDASTTLIRHETVQMLATFYGPQAATMAAVLRDGLAVDQNRAVLDSVGIGIYDISGPRVFGELIKEQWVRRADLPIILRREIRREYPILSLLRAHGRVEAGSTDFTFDVGIGSPGDPGQLVFNNPAQSGLLMAVGI